MKAKHILTSIVALVVLVSASAQEKKESFRADRNYGIGLNPIFNISSDGSDGNRTNDLNLGAVATASLNLRKNICSTIGIGILSNSFRSNFGISSYEVNRNSLLVQVGAFYSPFFLEVSDNSQLDLGLGIIGIYLNGKETVANEFGPDNEIDANSILFAPAIRGEWFITPHFTIHTQVGIFFSILSENNNGFASTQINIKPLLAGDMLGQSGFTFYF